MQQCARARKTRCAKCGDEVAAIEVASHRAKCVTINCGQCKEEVIPRIMKYCPMIIYRNCRYTKGPFAVEYLRERFIEGKSRTAAVAALANISTTSVPSPLSPSAATASPGSTASGSTSPSGPNEGKYQFPTLMTSSNTNATNNNSNDASGDNNNNNSPPPSCAECVVNPIPMPGEIDLCQVTEPDKKAKVVNFYVARVQHLWRWARARGLIEDILFKLIYKEIDTKKESFSVFKHQRVFEVDDEGNAFMNVRRNVPTGAPVATQGPQVGHYFPVSTKVAISPDLFDRVLQDIANNIPIPYYAVYRVFNETAESLKRYPNVQEVPSLEGARYVNGRWIPGGKANVVGDLHGQLSDLLKILEENGRPNEGNVFVFNGDFVDRGSKGFEVFFTLCMMFLAYPGQVFLNRGNHEVDYMNEEYGFDVEVQTKYDRNVFKLVQRCFNNLPLATLIGKKVFVVHAGVPRVSDVSIGDINEINRHREIPLPHYDQPEEDEIFQDMLWSDPMEKKGWLNSERGVGVLYGPDVSDAFMKTNALSLIIRSHETFMRGYEEHHGGRVITVFSCSNYDGPETNFGAFIVLLGGSIEPSFHTYQVTPDEYLAIQEEQEESSAVVASASAAAVSGGMDTTESMAMTRTMTSSMLTSTSMLGNVFWFTGLLHNRSRAAREDVLRSIRESMFERRHKLLAYFSKIDRTRKGTVWKMEWTEAMHNVLNLNVPWFFLRPYLCETEPPSQRVNYVKFLKRYRTAISKCFLESWVLNTAYDLQSKARQRKHVDAIRSLLKEPVVNYNAFCSVFKKIDNNLSDNALFELFIYFDESNTGVINGQEFLEFLDDCAADLEQRKQDLEEEREAAEAAGTSMATTSAATESQLNFDDMYWDLDAMNELEHILYTSRSTLHSLYKLPSKDTPLDKRAFMQGTKHLVRAVVKKLNTITADNIEAMWEWLVAENGREQISLDELFLCFLVRDFVLMENRLTWLGPENEEANQISQYYTLSWLIQPAASSSSATSGAGIVSPNNNNNNSQITDSSSPEHYSAGSTGVAVAAAVAENIASNNNNMIQPSTTPSKPSVSPAE